MQETMQTVFRQHFATLVNTRVLPPHQVVAAASILFCRTPVFGGHLHFCPEGHFEQFQYHSCNHRSCPLCGQLVTQSWLDGQQELLLGCEHYHVVFTIASELNELWPRNPAVMGKLLFDTARGTLTTLLADEAHLGATVGMMGVLHTWGRSLPLHPHVHFLVSGGGLDGEGRWRESKKGYLLPFRVVRKMFRAKYLSGLWRLLEKGLLTAPNGWTTGKVKSLLRRVAKGPRWNVYLKERYDHGEGVVKYLARYLTRGPISNRRILACDEETVTFAYTSHRDGKRHTMTLSGAEFVRRVLSHVPEPRFHTIRYYGLYANNSRVRLNQAREQLGQPPAPARRRRLTLASFWERQQGDSPLACPICGRELKIRTVAVRGIPPPIHLKLRHAN